jgi:hypothetical protein
MEIQMTTNVALFHNLVSVYVKWFRVDTTLERLASEPFTREATTLASWLVARIAQGQP